MVGTTVGANVSPEVKARLIKTARENSRTVNEVLKELIDGYLDDKEKMAHPEKFELSPNAKKVVFDSGDIIVKEDVQSVVTQAIHDLLDNTEFLKDFLEMNRYSLIKTSTLQKFLAVLKSKKEEKVKYLDR